MGSGESKPENTRRLSSKGGDLEKIQSEIAAIKRKIADGDIPQWDLFRSQLLNNARKVEELRKKKKQGPYKEECSKVLIEINRCFELLEENLDQGAVESNSFISQDVSKVLERKQKQREERIKSLSQIKGRLDELDEEIRAYVNENDVRSLIIVEKKLNILYHDLEEINPEPQTADMLEKERLVAMLVKYNRKINNVKRKSGVFDGNDGGLLSKPHPAPEKGGIIDVFSVTHELGDLEVNAFTFEDVRLSPAYTALEQTLKKHYTTLENVVADNEDEKRETSKAKNLIKKILSSLKQKAIENEDLMARQLIAIEDIEKAITSYSPQVQHLTSKESTNYHQLDQKIRSAWDGLKRIKTHFPEVQRKKDGCIAQVQNLLRTMDGNSNEFTRRARRLEKLKDLKSMVVSLERSDTIKKDENSLVLLEEIGESLRNFICKQKPDVVKHKDSVSSVIMDQLVTEITSEKMIKAEPVEDLRNIAGDEIITPVVNPTGKSIERIQKVENEITTLRNSIRNFSGTTDSELYDGIEDKLLKYKNEVESVNTDNRVISNAKERTLKKIEDVNLVLRSKAEVNDERVEQLRRSSTNIHRRSAVSINRVMQRIMEIDSNVHSLERQIRKFNGSTSDKEYEAIVKELNRNDQTVREVEVGGVENLESSKLEVMNHINRLQLEVATKASEYEGVVQDEVKKLKEVLRVAKQIKKKIDCFNGTYRSIQYNQLEDELKFNMENLQAVKDVNAKITQAKEQSRLTMEKYLKILEERSAKPQSFNVITLERAGITLLDIKNRMEYFAGTIHDDEYYQIIKDLHDCNEDIKTLTDEGDAGIRKQQFHTYIQELFNYFDAKMNISSAHDPNEDKIQENLKKLEIYKSETDAITQKINSYTGDGTITEYSTIDEQLINLMIKVDKLNTYSSPEIKEKRKEIMQRLNRSSEILDEKCRPFMDTTAAPNRAKILAEIERIVEKVDLLNESVRRFEGTQYDQRYVELDEALISIFLKLDSVNPSSDSVAKNSKIKALSAVKNTMKLLEEKINPYQSSKQQQGGLEDNVNPYESSKYGLEETLV